MKLAIQTKRRPVLCGLGLLIALALPGCATPEKAEWRGPKAARIGTTKTVVFVHGMFMTNACWDQWEAYFQEKGYKVHAPAWPLHDAPAAELRKKHPDPALAKLTLPEVVASYRKFIQGLDEKPIVVGHSMGGLVSQLLLAEGLVAAAVVIDSAPPKGIISLKWSFLKSNWGHASPFANDDEALMLTQEKFNYAFVNGWPEDKQKAIYEAGVVPESRRVGKGPTTAFAKIEYARARGPLLFVAGEKDHIIPASLNYSNFKAYEESPSLTAFRQFRGMTHAIIQQEGWKEVAGYVVEWIEANR